MIFNNDLNSENGWIEFALRQPEEEEELTVQTTETILKNEGEEK